METQNYSKNRTENETIGRNRSNLWKGIGLLSIFHAINILGTSLWWDTLMGISFIGITQLVYVIPTILVFTIIKRDGWIEGLAIGSAVTILLSPAITGAIILYMVRRSGL